MTDHSLRTQDIFAGSGVFTDTSFTKQEQNSSVTETYAEILAVKIATIDDELKRLEKVREDIEEIDTLRRDAEEHGTITSSSAEATETVRRVMGDGTILVTTTKDGKIVEQYRKKPQMVLAPDPTAPADALPSEKYRMQPRQNPLDMLAFM